MSTATAPHKEFVVRLVHCAKPAQMLLPSMPLQGILALETARRSRTAKRLRLRRERQGASLCILYCASRRADKAHVAPAAEHAHRKPSTSGAGRVLSAIFPGRLGRTRLVCRSLGHAPRLGEELEKPAESIIDDALRAFGTYHTRPAAVRRGDRVFHEDRNLLYYYSNRLRGYDLGRRLATGGRS